MRRDEDVLPKTLVSLAETRGTPFEAFEKLGMIPEGTTPGGPWTAVARMYARPANELIMLSEWDFVIDKGGVLLIREFLNVEVRGEAGTLVVISGSRGERLTIVSWVRGSKQYKLQVQCQAQPCLAEVEVLALAASL